MSQTNVIFGTQTSTREISVHNIQIGTWFTAYLQEFEGLFLKTYSGIVLIKDFTNSDIKVGQKTWTYGTNLTFTNYNEYNATITINKIEVKL